MKQARTIQYSPVVVSFALKVPLIIVTVWRDRNGSFGIDATLVIKYAKSNQNGLLARSMIKTTDSVSKGFRVVGKIGNLHTIKVPQKLLLDRLRSPHTGGNFLRRRWRRGRNTRHVIAAIEHEQVVEVVAKMPKSVRPLASMAEMIKSN